MQLVEGAKNDIHRARLLASSAKESGAWLHALSISALELQLNDNSLTIAVGLHLGSLLHAPINVHIVGRRLILWAGMVGLAVNGVREISQACCHQQHC